MKHKKPFKKAIFIFRRDLRLYDNHGLREATRQAEQVLPVFIFDPEQVGPENRYRSDNALQFMFQALKSLGDQIRDQHGDLYFLYGNPQDCLAKLMEQLSVDALFVNRDYTPFSRKRDADLAQLCAQFTIPFVVNNDLLLHEPESVLTKAGTPYKTFTPFLKAVYRRTVEKPEALPTVHWYQKRVPVAMSLAGLEKKILPEENSSLAVQGTHAQAQEILEALANFKEYEHERNRPSVPTTHLSAYLKFGLLSVRQVYYRLKEINARNNGLIAQLYWRDFFTHAVFHNPKLLGHAGIARYETVAWSYDRKKFQAWCMGKTGFPLVDAGMRQLNKTGFMHNRVRMITASFLVKDLQIDWRWGERYFAHKLVDYDPAVNNGNWQWVASTGTCSQPYFRVFNPWLQQKRYDADCAYIKRWIPELAQLTPKQIHSLSKCAEPIVAEYPLPMLEHDVAAKKSIRLFKDAFQ